MPEVHILIHLGFVLLFSAVPPLLYLIVRIGRLFLEKGPVSMHYRGADGTEYTASVDPTDPKSIHRFLMRAREQQEADSAA